MRTLRVFKLTEEAEKKGLTGTILTRKTLKQ